MSLEDKNIAVFVADDYEDLEAWYPILRLREEGAKVTVIASDNVEGDIVASKHGYNIEVDKKAADASPEMYDGAIIPGGWAPDKLRLCQNTLYFVRKMVEENKVTAAICHGGWVLASANVIDGKKVTSTQAIMVDLKNAGAEWVDREVVVDDYLITSRHPGDLPAFCKKIIEKLEEY